MIISNSYKLYLYIAVLIIMIMHPVLSVSGQIDNDSLPSLLVSYSLYASYNKYFNDNFEKKNNQNWYSVLEKNFEKLSCDINTRLSFSHVSFVVQDVFGSKYGDETRNNFNNQKSVMFVSVPLNKIGNKVLVVLSSTAPNRSTVMTVDNNLDVNLLYDSFIHGEKSGLVCCLSSALVLKDNVIEFIEGRGCRCNPPDASKSMLFDAATGSIVIRDTQ